jgi:hypothetical protein
MYHSYTDKHPNAITKLFNFLNFLNKRGNSKWKWLNHIPSLKIKTPSSEWSTKNILPQEAASERIASPSSGPGGGSAPLVPHALCLGTGPAMHSTPGDWTADHPAFPWLIRT